MKIMHQDGTSYPNNLKLKFNTLQLGTILDKGRKHPCDMVFKCNNRNNGSFSVFIMNIILQVFEQLLIIINKKTQNNFNVFKKKKNPCIII